MTIVIGDITMSLDGYVSGEGPAVERLHTWALDSDDLVDADVLRRHTAASGAVVMGRRTWDVVDAPGGWDDDLGYGAREATQGSTAFVVVTHEPPASVRQDIDVTFVDSLEAAVARAREVAGSREVFVMGGAAVVGGCLRAGLLDELRLHLAPEILGTGTALFDDVGAHRLVQRSVEVSPVAVHLTYDVQRLP